MTKPTPRKMRGKDGVIHDEHPGFCTRLGCVPVEPEPSRSVQRRVAVQKGEPVPTFEPEPPTGHRWAGSGDYGGDAGGTQKMCVNCGVDMQDDEALAPCPNPVAPETPELCADCHRPKNDHTMHLDAPGANWSSAMHWFRAPQGPGMTRMPMDWGDALRNLLKLAPMGDATRYFRNGIQFVLDTPASPSRAIPEAELQRVAREIYSSGTRLNPVEILGDLAHLGEEGMSDETICKYCGCTLCHGDDEEECSRNPNPRTKAAFDCHFSDIRPYLQHREECRKWYERYEQQIFIGQDIDEEKPCTCGLAKLEEKYGRKP